MKKSAIVKRVILLLLAVFFVLCMCVWIAACLFAAGQLNDSYNLWTYFSEAPVSVLIAACLLGAAIACIVGASKICKK